MTTYTLTGLTRNSGLDFTVDVPSSGLRGFCRWNGYWRAIGRNNHIVYGFDDDGNEVADQIDLSSSMLSGSASQGLTTDGVNLLVLEDTAADGGRVHVVNTSGTVTATLSISISSELSNLDGHVYGIGFDSFTQHIWAGCSGAGSNRVRFINYSLDDGAPISTGFSGIAGHRFSAGLVIWNEILFSADSESDRLYAYELDGTNITDVNDSVIGSIQGLGQRDNKLYAADLSNSVDVWNIVSTISVPDAPINLDGSEVSSEVTLTWDDPSDDTITGYKIFRKTGSGAYSTLVNNTASTTQSYTDDTVAEGTEYTYKIQAINDTGNSGDSNEFNITTASTGTVPDAPTGLTGTENTDGEVVLTWADPSDDTITDYAIFRKVGNGTYTELTTTALITGQAYTDDTAVHGTGYTYKIRAINATGNSADSNEFPFTTAVSDTTAPTIDSGIPLSANVTSTSVQWRITFSEDVENVDETDFGIKRVGVANFNPDSVTQISASIYDVFGTLPEPDVYHLRLRVTSDITDLSGNLRSGTGEISGSTITYTASTIDPPDAPTGLALTEDNPTEVTVTWDVSTDETITDYNIYRGEVFGGPYTLLVDIVFDVTTDEGSYVDDTAEFDTTYYYVIRAENDGGESDNSTEVGITTDEEVAEDTTAPTFTIDGNDDDFDTTLELGNTYTEFEFRNKVDIDTSLDDTIIYKNSSGAVITSFDGIAPSEGSYTIEYTLTDDADNSTTIVESLTVEDTTNPTFEVDGNSADFATTVVYDGTYTVKDITEIVDASTTVSTITGNTAVDTSTAGDYLVTYTVTDDSANANATSIVETVTVSAEVIDTEDNLLIFSESPNSEIPNSTTITRTITIPDTYNGTISSLICNVDITHPLAYDLRIRLLSPEGTEVLFWDFAGGANPFTPQEFTTSDFDDEMTAGDWTLTIRDLPPTDGGTLNSWDLRIETDEGLDNSGDAPAETVPENPTSVTAIEVSGNVVLEWADASDDSITGYKIFRKTGTGAFTTLVTDTASTTLTYTDTTVSVDTDYTYKIQAINDVGNSGDSHEVTITTDPTPDTTAPTFTVEANGDDNTANFTTTVAFNGTYTVGTIADISETGTTSAISGNTNVDTGTAGEYTVTYTVTDTAGNSTEIVETITVSEEVITDSTAPTILSAVPSSANVTDPAVSWRVTFSEDVENVDTTDFAIRETGVPQEDPDSITVISASVYDVFYTLPDVGIYHFRIRNNSNIADLSGNVRTQSGEIPNSTITYTAAVVEDTTAPTFDVDGNTEDYNTELTDDETYDVGTVDNIIDDGTTTTSDPVYKDSTGAVISSFDNTMLSAGDYSVEYTVTDDSDNAFTIVESITVTEVVIADGTLTITRGTNDYDLPTEINNASGLCWFNGYWRICDTSDDIVYALDTSFDRVSSEDITNIPSGSQMRGLTKTATHLLVLFFDTTNGHYVRMYDTDNNFVMQFTLTGFPSDTMFASSTGYDEINNRILVGVDGPSGGVGHIGAFAIPTIVTGTIPSTALISSASFDCTTEQLRVDSMVWYEGYVITTDLTDDRFYVYKLSDQSLVSDIDDDVSSNVHGLGLKDGSLYLADRTANAVDEWIVNITSAEEDTTAPTFEVDDNDADYATTVVFGGTYTVGVISDISETGTTSVISGDDDVDTSVAGEYTVTYTVTDAANNSTEIVETVTVSAEIDTTAPTFQVDDNTTDYATTVAFEGTYTVGVISDISETGTTSTITGNNDVDTSTAGEYTVTYTVTDTAGNAGEIVETVTVSTEVIVPDTTAPTFTVKTYSADFDITIELGAVYNVGTFDDITDEDASPSEDIVYKNSAGTYNNIF